MRPNPVRAIRAPWTKPFVGALALLVVGAVLVCGVATLAGAPLSDMESGAIAGVSSTPFTFDAPTATLERVKPTEARAGRAPAASASAPLVLGDWKFTQATTPDTAELIFLTGVLINDPEFFTAMVIMVAFPGFTDFVQGLSGGNDFLELLIIDLIATILLRGENPLLKDVTPPPPPPAVSPTT